MELPHRLSLGFPAPQRPAEPDGRPADKDLDAQPCDGNYPERLHESMNELFFGGVRNAEGSLDLDLDLK